MKRIKLKDYKGEYICYITEDGATQPVMADDTLYIKKLTEEGVVFYGTTKEKVFESPYWDIREMIKSTVDDRGYEDMDDRIDYHSKELEAIVEAYEEWIESLGTDNDIYYQDENVIIEVDE